MPPEGKTVRFFIGDLRKINAYYNNICLMSWPKVSQGMQDWQRISCKEYKTAELKERKKFLRLGQTSFLHSIEGIIQNQEKNEKDHAKQ